MTPCDFRTHRECACPPDQCQQQRPAYGLANHRKPVPLYMPSLRDGLALAAMGLTLFLGGALLLETSLKRQSLIEQESRAVVRAAK
ncbi:hypothetical protein [Agrobacterium vitis]|uniref:hypothetical protein n=1 Tax=Agrobacterium vitis TaxID=373 RepID=UPI0015730A79|nr:hypothetical protein [Agrobacterium vitis]NSY12427.1 hypothetical protein [Agrobacterium vitis]NSY22256.1 hypothetical protein [Agrobacterium vitis]NTA21957.1 hypothetical protein [Agrobacterium vitis]WEO70255.1 hypothetical protein G6L01_009525 [Agrobacterium vitis]